MNHQPQYYWLFRLPDGRVAGDEMESWKWNWQFLKRFVIEGKTATFRCVTNHTSITREEAIAFCYAVVQGRIRRISIDLHNV